MYASAGGHDECVKLLSDMGAQANQQDKVRPILTNTDISLSSRV